MNARILILGGTGFVGRALCEALARQSPGTRLRVPTRRPANARAVQLLPQVEVLSADVHDDAALDRLLMRAGRKLFAGHRFPDLRFVASVGEALNPEAVWWGEEVLGRPIHDNWWQSETGGIMIANTATQDIKPGSMGRPLPGISAHVVRHVEGEPVTPIETPNTIGALRRVLCRAALPDRRSGMARCRWLLLVCWAQRRRDQVIRSPDRRLRGGECADGA